MSHAAALTALVLLAPAPAAAIPVVDGLQGYWPADGNANDASGNGNHGTAAGDASYATGRFGQAFALDGDGDFILVSSDPTLDATGPFSIAAWVKRASTGSYHTIVDRGLGVSDPDSSYTLRLEIDDEAIFEWEQNGTNASVTSGSTITDGKWHHVTGVFDGTTNSIYVDGALASSSGTALTPTVTQQSLQIGARLRSGPTYDLFFHGLVDEVAFYDRALTPGEVELIAAAPSSVPALAPDALAVLCALLAWTPRRAARAVAAVR